MTLLPFRLLILAGALGVLGVLAQGTDHQKTEENPLELLERWFIQEFRASGGRSRRDLLQLLAMIPGLASLAPLLAPLLANANVSALLSTALAVAQEALSYLHCCQSVTVPAVFVDSLLQCVQDPATNFVSNVSTTVSGRQAHAAKMIEPPVEGSQICNLVEGEMCTARCAFQKLNLLAEDGLPSSGAMTAALPGMVASSPQLDVMRPAMEACDLELRAAQDAKEGEISESEKCWASNAMLSCMQRQIFEECPEKQKQKGPVCILKLGKSFLRNLPGKALEMTENILNGLKTILMGS